MGARHHESFVSYVLAAATGRYYIQEKVDGYRKPDDVPYKHLALKHRKTNEELASVKAQTLPGCCGVLLLHAFTGSDATNTVLIDFIVEGAKRAKYGMVLFTMRDGHRVPHALTSFRNGKTGNVVIVYGVPTGAQYAPSNSMED